jgi:mRNA interferase RelE/StbE
MYEIRFTTTAKKYFKKLVDKKLKNTFLNSIEKIADDPNIGTQKTGDLKGVYGYDFMYNIHDEVLEIIANVVKELM